jgi:hypothetical protein
VPQRREDVASPTIAGGDPRRTYAAAEQRRRKEALRRDGSTPPAMGVPRCGGSATAQDLCLPSSRGGDGRREEGPVGVRASAAARAPASGGYGTREGGRGGQGGCVPPH